MNFSALALDYDGTIAVDGVFDPAVREAVGDAQRRGIVVIGHVPSGAEEAHGQVRHFQLAPRLTSHVRHRTKYLEMPVVDSQAFVFTGDGRPGARARTPKEFTGSLAALPSDRLAGYLRRHDFSRWIEEVFRDRPLAAHLRNVEAGVETDNPRDVADSVAQAIRSRYDTAVEGL